MSITSELEPLACKQPSYARLALLVALAGGGYIMGSIPLSLMVITQEKVDRTSAGFDKETVARSQTLYWIGWAAASLLVVPMADKLGRKPLYFSLLFGGIAATILLSAARSVCLYGVAIFLVGAQLKSASMVGYLLMQEEVPERLWQPLVVALNLCSGLVTLSFTLVGGTLAIDLSWRTETLLWHIPYAMVLLIGPLFLKESPYFAKGVAQSGSFLSDLCQTGPLRQLFGSRELRTRLIATVPCWLACVVGYFGISYSSGSLSPHLYTNLTLFCVTDIVSYVLATPIMHVAGPRKAQLLSFLVAVCCFVVCGCLPPGQARVAVAIVGRVCLDVIWTTIYVLAMHCFPAECRGTAVGIANFFARISAVVTPFFSLMPVPACCTVMSVCCLVAAAATWVLPEPEQMRSGGHEV